MYDLANVHCGGVKLLFSSGNVNAKLPTMLGPPSFGFPKP